MLENTEAIVTITEDSAGVLKLVRGLIEATHIAANTGGYLARVRKTKRIFRRISEMIRPRVVGYSHGMIIEPVYEYLGRFCSVADLIGETVLVSRLVTGDPTLTVRRVSKRYAAIMFPSGLYGPYSRIYRWAFAYIEGTQKHT